MWNPPPCPCTSLISSPCEADAALSEDWRALSRLAVAEAPHPAAAWPGSGCAAPHKRCPLKPCLALDPSPCRAGWSWEPAQLHRHPGDAHRDQQCPGCTPRHWQRLGLVASRRRMRPSSTGIQKPVIKHPHLALLLQGTPPSLPALFAAGCVFCSLPANSKAASRSQPGPMAVPSSSLR